MDDKTQQRLAILGKLRDQGLLSDEQFESQKASILAESDAPTPPSPVTTATPEPPPTAETFAPPPAAPTVERPPAPEAPTSSVKFEPIVQPHRQSGLGPVVIVVVVLVLLLAGAGAAAWFMPGPHEQLARLISGPAFGFLHKGAAPAAPPTVAPPAAPSSPPAPVDVAGQAPAAPTDASPPAPAPAAPVDTAEAPSPPPVAPPPRAHSPTPAAKPVHLATTADAARKSYAGPINDGGGALGPPNAGGVCALATSGIQQMVCSNPTVLAQHRQMTSIFFRNLARMQPSDKDAYRDAQKLWAQTVRNRCRTEQCLESAYARRITQLQSGSAGANY